MPCFSAKTTRRPPPPRSTPPFRRAILPRRACCGKSSDSTNKHCSKRARISSFPSSDSRPPNSSKACVSTTTRKPQTSTPRSPRSTNLKIPKISSGSAAAKTRIATSPSLPTASQNTRRPRF